RHGLILPPHNKDVGLFPEKVGGRHWLLHRPSGLGPGGNFIWLAESPDMLHWGGHTCIATTRPGHWDSERIGAGAAPLKTDRGWLSIYHGADRNGRYCLGGLLLDLNNPRRVIARSREPLMTPVESYERNGFFGNVVFTNGHVLEGDRLTLYYGAADSVICGAELSLAEILRTL
ncbi:MAG: glycosidase, partial [Rariglobus sp.]